MEILQAFAISPPGFEDLVDLEIRSTGISKSTIVFGGVEFETDWAGVYRVNLMSRVANRVLIRIKTFEASNFPRLEKELRRIDWARWLREPRLVSLKVAKHRTKLYHTGKVAELAAKVMGAVECKDDGAGDLQELYLRIDGKLVTVSIDSSGERLHRRGYRQHGVEAPLRENLAAGLIMRTGWTANEPFLDPMCGSGTFAAEAGLMAINAAPGLNRSFAFERLPTFNKKIWEKIKTQAEEKILKQTPAQIFASDVSEDALRIAARSLRLARLADVVQVAQVDIQDLEPPCQTGFLAANPPYGIRLGGARNAYESLGKALRGPFHNWRWAIVFGKPHMKKVADIKPSSIYPFKNGGLSLEFAMGGLDV